MNVELKEVEEGFVELTITPVKPRERLRDRNHARATAPVSEVFCLARPDLRMIDGCHARDCFFVVPSTLDTISFIINFI